MRWSIQGISVVAVLLGASCHGECSAEQYWRTCSSNPLDARESAGIQAFLEAEERLVRKQVETDWLERQYRNGVHGLDEIALRAAVNLDVVQAKRRSLAAGGVRLVHHELRAPIVGATACVAFGRYGGEVFAFRLSRDYQEDACEGLAALLELSERR